MLHEGLVLLRRPVARMVHETALKAVAFSPEDKYLAAAGEDGSVRVWEQTTFREVTRMDPGKYRSVNALSFDVAGRHLAAAGLFGMQLWDATRDWKESALEHRTPGRVALGSDGRYLAIIELAETGPESVRVLDTTNGQELARMADGLQGKGISMAFSLDGRYLGVSSRLPDGEGDTTYVWNAMNGQRIARIPHGIPVVSIAFSPDAKLLATGSFDNIARIWDIKSGRELARLLHQSVVNAVAFSPDGQYVATASDDNTARLLDTASRQEVARLSHEDSIKAVAFSPDGRYLATGSKDKTVRVWQVNSGPEIARVRHPDDIVFDVAFSPDGRRFATASGDKTARLWELGSGRENCESLRRIGSRPWRSVPTDASWRPRVMWTPPLGFGI